MGIKNLPLLGFFATNQVPIAGQTGTNALTGAVVNPSANEVSISRFALSGATITLDGTNATVTLASHLNTIVGQQVTFSGVTGVTGLNNQTWTIATIPTSGTYTFPCTLTGTPAGTIVQHPVFTLPYGYNFFSLGANAVIEYNADNTYNATNGGTSGAQTWRQIFAASTAGSVPSDGFAVRLRCSGTTATSTFTNVI